MQRRCRYVFPYYYGPTPLNTHPAPLTLFSPAQLPAGLLYVRLIKVEATVHSKIGVINALRDVEAVTDTGPAHIVDLVETVDSKYEEHAGVYEHIGELFQELHAIKAVVDEVAKVSSCFVGLLRDSDDE